MVIRSAQRGNILFLILLAVVLFAALSYAVTQSTRGGGNDVSAEKAQANAARYLQFTTLLENITQRMMMSGVKESEIAFSANPYQLVIDAYACKNDNPNCATNSCKVFNPAGGGASPLLFEDIAYTPSSWTTSGNTTMRPGHLGVRQGAIAGVGTSAPDLLILIAGIDSTTCNLINQKMGITTNFTSSSAAAEPAATSMAEYYAGCGAYHGFVSTRMFGDEDSRFFGQRTFCAPMDGNVGYNYLVQVVLAR